MMIKHALGLVALSLLISGTTLAQNTLGGYLQNTKGTKLGYATVTLLFPEDSTLAYFDISDTDGRFEISDIKDGNYILQAAFLGYKTHMRPVQLTGKPKNTEIGLIKLESESIGLEAVEIEGAAVPFLIKKDTLEYNAAAFRVRTNATAEDLLKKLPGVEVDSDGNIKAQGEDVNKVLVDGKEFFSNDPTMATKNVPADAVKKVQVFDRKSEAAQFTGIDDGEREKTINLELKDDRKNGAFGEATAGYGTDDRYLLNGKVSKFTEKTQSMALANANNLNDFGLSIMDYLNFSGNTGALGGGRFSINSNGSIPINTGQNQNGELESILGGATFAYSPKKNNDLSANYLYSHADRYLIENSDYIQYTPNQDIRTISNDESVEKGDNHAFNLFWRNEIDSLNKLNLKASYSLSTNNNRNLSNSNNFNADSDRLSGSIINNFSDQLSNNYSAEATYIRKLNNQGQNLELSYSINGSASENGNEWNNTFFFDDPNNGINTAEDWTINQNALNHSATVKYNQPLGKNYFMEWRTVANSEQDEYQRIERDLSDSQLNNNTQLNRELLQLSPGLRLKKNTEKGSLALGLDYQLNAFNANSNDQINPNSLYTQEKNLEENAFLPSLSYRKRFGKRNFLRIRASQSLNFPSNNQLFPVPNTQNQINISQGNMDLEATKVSSVSTGFMLYDEFTFTSFSLWASANHTDNNITRSINIDDRSFQRISYINYGEALRLNANMHFNKPIKKLGLVVNLSGSENYSLSQTLVNGEENELSTATHEGSFSLSNKKKKKIDLSVGIGFSLTDSKYSLQQGLNNRYTTTRYFADAEYYLSDALTISANLDYNIYDSQAFAEQQNVPLLNAEVNYTFLKANSGILTLSVFDLLNQYNGVNRFSIENTIGETRSNVLTQYFLLSFTYKFNQLAGGASDGIKVRMR